MYLYVELWDALIARRLERGDSLPQGLKRVGEWMAVGGGRGFILLEATDVNPMIENTILWNDLMEIETFPVANLEDVMKFLQ
jgi:hypothetical protein